MKYFFPLLGLLFIALKLTGHIAWSWWLVLLPLYGGLVLALAILAVPLVILLIAALMDGKR